LSKNKKVVYEKAGLEQLQKKYKGVFDLVIMVRVMHHLEDPNDAICGLGEMTKKGGYMIVEFANKLHWKAVLSNMIRGNFTFPLEIFPIERGRRKSKKKKLPFRNYHPDILAKCFLDNGIEIIEKRSVSNLRIPIIKKFFPVEWLLWVEEKLQKPLARINFGPSVFILAKKTSR